MDEPLVANSGVTDGGASAASDPARAREATAETANGLSAGLPPEPPETPAKAEVVRRSPAPRHENADQQTLSALRRGQWTAMEELVRRYQDRLYSTVFRIVNNPDDAADLVQETFVKALQNLAKFEGKSSLYTWLFRIAVNLAISHRRSLHYRSALSLDVPEDDGELNQQAAGLRRQLAQETETDPAEDAAMRLDHQRVLEALQGLEPEFRAVIVLRDVEDCDYEQIAQIMDVPVGTIKSRLFRARTALRDAIQKAPRAGRRLA